MPFVGSQLMDSFYHARHRTIQCVNLLVIITVTAALPGCGDNLAQVTGRVTVGGQPFRGGNGVKATVFFQPAAGGASAIGLVDGEGAYTLITGSREGIVPGEYLVTFSATQIIPAATPGGTPGGKRISDTKYASAKTSGLRFSVQTGVNQYDIALESPRANTR